MRRNTIHIGANLTGSAAPRGALTDILNRTTVEKTFSGSIVDNAIQQHIISDTQPLWMASYAGYGRPDLGGPGGSIEYVMRAGKSYRAKVATVPPGSDPTTDTTNWQAIQPSIPSVRSGIHAFGSTGSALSQLYNVVFSSPFPAGSAVRVVVTYQWNYDVVANGTIKSPAIIVEGISTSAFGYRINGDRHSLDRVLYIAHAE